MVSSWLLDELVQFTEPNKIIIIIIIILDHFLHESNAWLGQRVIEIEAISPLLFYFETNGLVVY